MKVAETYDLTVMQALTLCLMEDKTPMPMNGLSHALHCDASNVTSVVDRLVTLGYIERKESAQDRRVKTIRLSLKGVRVRRQIMKKNGRFRIIQDGRPFRRRARDPEAVASQDTRLRVLCPK